MSLRDYMRLIRRRWLIIVLVTVIGTAGATALSVTAQPMYASSVKLLVSAAQTGSPLNSALAPNLLTQERISSYAELASGPTVANAVIRKLGLSETPSTLEQRTTASVPTQTVLIVITVTDPSAFRARAIANAVGATTARLIVQLESGRHAPSPVRARIAEPASLPSAPSSPKTARNIAFGFIVGLALGFALAILREVLDTRIKGPEDLSALGVPLLGLTRYERRMRTRPILAPDALDPSVAETLRQLRTNLEFVDIGARPRSLLIASSLAEEGKSTTAWNLAIAFAAARKRVVVVEADLRRPSLSTRYLKLSPRRGLSDVLIGKASAEEVETSWMDGRLTLLPSGTVPPNPSELLGSDAMKSLVQGVVEHADVVLVDAPPLLPFADAAVLAATVDATLLVVRSNKTKRDQVARALDLINRVGGRVCGVVLTMAPKRGPESEDYGYYGYGYRLEPTPRADAEPRPHSGEHNLSAASADLTREHRSSEWSQSPSSSSPAAGSATVDAFATPAPASNASNVSDHEHATDADAESNGSDRWKFRLRSRRETTNP